MKVEDLWIELDHIEGREHVERQGDGCEGGGKEEAIPPVEPPVSPLRQV